MVRRRHKPALRAVEFVGQAAVKARKAKTKAPAAAAAAAEAPQIAKAKKGLTQKQQKVTGMPAAVLARLATFLPFRASSTISVRAAPAASTCWCAPASARRASTLARCVCMYDCERRPYSFPLPLLLLMLLSPPPQKPCQCPLSVQVDLIVAFDAADSPIRAVQRLVRARLSHVGAMAGCRAALGAVAAAGVYCCLPMARSPSPSVILPACRHASLLDVCLRMYAG